MFIDGKFEVGVKCRLVVEGVYEVWCNHCSGSIGTMASHTILDAIFATLGRGGVLCPGCRKHTCDGCGTYIADKGLRMALKPLGGEVRVCPSCEHLLEIHRSGETLGAVLKDWGDCYDESPM